MIAKYSTSLLLIVVSLSFCTPLTQLSAQDPPDFEIEMPDGFDDFSVEDGPVGLTPEQEAAATAVTFVSMAVSAVVGLIFLALFVWIAYSLMDALNSVPEEHRQLAPFIPWLLFVPVVNIVILILVFIKVPESLQSYLAERGDTSQGDCGKAMGLWGAILYLLVCTMPIGLVLLIISLMRINSAKQAARAAVAT